MITKTPPDPGYERAYLALRHKINMCLISANSHCRDEDLMLEDLFLVIEEAGSMMTRGVKLSLVKEK